MDSVDLAHEDRQMIESVLAMLETLAGRLNAGDPVPNGILGDVVEFLREYDNATYGASSQVILHRMQWALESLERGEAGAAGAFVISARENIRAYRDHIQAPRADPEAISRHAALVRRFNRLTGRYRNLIDRPAPREL
jgi:hemerythrin-like domain-containing protein